MVLTGGARGIGAAIACRLHSEGARLALLDRLAEPGLATARRLDSFFVRTDLADPAAAGWAMESAISSLGGVDALVNCAGILQRGSLLSATVADWEQVFAVNARSVLLTMQPAARSMIEAGTGGRIVNIASMAAKAGGADEGVYAASKAAVVALTRAGALEWGCHGITVNALCPGYVLTEMGADTRTEADVQRWSARSPLGRLGTPDDIAAAVSYLVSADGAYLTGQAINITGGMVMH